LWRLSDVPPIRRLIASPTQIGAMTETGEMLTLSTDGTLIDRARLREAGSMALAPSGALVAYTRGGLWQIGAAGEWSPLIDSAPAGGDASAVTFDADGRLYLFDGAQFSAYDRDGNPLWAHAIPNVAGQAEFAVYGSVILLVTSAGNVLAFERESGGLCNQTRIYGDWRSTAWHQLGSDGILRLHVADQIIGLDWETFLLACA
jgi:hypothetical protein